MYSSLMFESEKYLSELSGCTMKQIQLLALEHHIVPERYVRNQASLSISDQIRLLKSHVLVVGLGGLGGAVTGILSRMGVGKLTLVDGDRFEDSNLNRQLLSTVNDLGRPKTVVAAEHVVQVNPAVEVVSHAVFMDSNNVQDLIGDADVGVDCLDTIPARFVLEEGCRGHGIPMVSAAIGGKSGQVTVMYPEDHGLSRIYGDQLKSPVKGVEKRVGTLAYTAMTMAALECSEVISILTGGTSKLRNGLLFADLDDYSMMLLDFSQ